LSWVPSLDPDDPNYNPHLAGKRALGFVFYKGYPVDDL
jgi:hypothetical protein